MVQEDEYDGKASRASGQSRLCRRGRQSSTVWLISLLLLRYERRGALSVWIWIWMDDGSYPYSWLLDTCMAVMSQPLPLPRGLQKCQPTNIYNSTVDSYPSAGRDRRQSLAFLFLSCCTRDRWNEAAAIHRTQAHREPLYACMHGMKKLGFTHQATLAVHTYITYI